jgi:hypothetical protein
MVHLVKMLEHMNTFFKYIHMRTFSICLTLMLLFMLFILLWVNMSVVQSFNSQSHVVEVLIVRGVQRARIHQ